MRRLSSARVAIAIAVAAATAPIAPFSLAGELKPLDSFSGITDAEARGRAVFAEIGRVLQHPRCLNCHPAGDVPMQGEAMTPHQPPVTRGDAGFGVPGMRCNVCHQEKNIDHAGLPGHPKWHLAPRTMAWAGKSLGQICRQIKDPALNGGMDIAALKKHMAEDDLVGWGWKPDAGRAPAPGTQAAFGKLFAYWVDEGAHCPTP